MLAALTLLPALLAMLGPKVDALSVRPLLPPAVPPPGRGRGPRGARRLVPHRAERHAPSGPLHGRRPSRCCSRWPLPFLRVEFGGIDARVLPDGHREPGGHRDHRRATSRRTRPRPIDAVVTLRRRRSTPPPAARRWRPTSTAWPHVPGVTGAEVTGAAGHDGPGRRRLRRRPDRRARRRTWWPTSARVPAPDGGEVLVGGQTATLVDLLDSLGDLLPWMALMVVAATFVLLFLAFGSVVLPIKAIVMNVLSLGASFGALVWIFQDGNLSGFLGFTPTGHGRGDAADPGAGDRVRAVDGLRGLPACPASASSTT